MTPSLSSFITFSFLLATQLFTFAQQTPPPPNYSNSKAWAVLPDKYPDILSAFDGFKNDSLKADVFFLYPTMNGDKNDERWNVPYNDSLQQEKVLARSIQFQASAFLPSGKLYAPYYRQAHLRSYEHLDGEGLAALQLAYADVRQAFIFYLENYNNGRPIILASHSQGATHALLLLKEFFDCKPLQNQLIAAYLPGIGVNPDELNCIALLDEPEKTGGYVSWNSYKRGYFPDDFKKWYENRAVVNPVTWLAAGKAERKDHKGFLFENKKIYSNSFTTEVKNGIIWLSLPHFPYKWFFLRQKRYHVGDINLFWVDIKENCRLRTNHFLSKNKKQALAHGKDVEPFFLLKQTLFAV